MDLKKVDIEYVKDLKKKLREINVIPFENIVWTNKGEAIPIDKEVREEFQFTGLNNVDFVDFIEKPESFTMMYIGKKE